MDAHSNVKITGKLINEHIRKCEAENVTSTTINDELSEIDPDNHKVNDLSVHCKYYTQPEFNTTFSLSKNCSIMHANNRSSEANLKEFTNYLNDLNIKFIFIILYETWAKEHNTDMHIIIMTIIQESVDHFMYLWERQLLSIEHLDFVA